MARITTDDAPVTLTARDDLAAGAEGTVKVLDASMGAEMRALDLPDGALRTELAAGAGNLTVSGPMG
ncbi:hypothetical protein ACFYY3_33420 [Streptomyces sp. NPDC001812]|uniref:Adhesin domain-containing protein n=1 Tax=Streptomyces cathayae TaxID=3031124 RepID=A0ABY8JU94_9ACTN|nr:hypothetical protein [Streptomyces sp. HUAS 5]WGD39207.1 hypothetical protein PYS65_02980 [Streptomyces sp. HUAS 5]